MKHNKPTILVIGLLLLFLGGWFSDPSARPLAENKKISLTFDDLPALGPLGFWRPREISNTILRTLDRHEIKAAGFVVGEKIDDDLSTFIVLEDWVSRGHILGNQTYSDVDLNELSTKDFLEHVADGQNYLRRLSRAYPFNYRYLRYPFLHQGNKRTKKGVAKALYNANYEIAHVTVKTSDDQFNRIYIGNEREPEKIAQLKLLYLEHITQALDYAESQSEKVFGRNINHILWLHGGAVTANFLEDLINQLLARGYHFIPFPEALSDPAFETEENYVGPLGLSFIDRVAASRGLPFDPEHDVISSREIEKRLAEY